MNEGEKFDLLDLQKNELTPEEIEKIYPNPEKSGTEFEGTDEDENNNEVIPEKSEDEKIEEALLKGVDKKRKDKPILEDSESVQEPKVKDKEKDQSIPAIPEIVKEAIAVAKKRQGELENNMYEQLYEKLEKEYEEADNQNLYIKKLKEDLKRFAIGNIDREDKEFLKNFGFNEKDEENKGEILESYEKVVSKILGELENAEETDDTDDKEKKYTADDFTKAQREAEAVKSEVEKVERRWNNLEDFLKRDIASLREDYNKPIIKESVIASIKENMESYTVDEEHMKSFLEMTKIEFTEENKERLFVLASKLYGDLLRELEIEPEIESETEAGTLEGVESSGPEISEGEKRRDAENLEGEKTARESRDKMWNRVTEIGKKIADNPEMSSEDREKIEDKRSMETVSSIMFEVNLASYEDPKKKRRRLEDAVTAMEVSLLKQKTETEIKMTKLTEVKAKAAEKFGIASDEEIEGRIFQKDNKRTEGSEEKSKFGWLKEKLGIGGENIKEMKEKISEATNLEDLAEVANLIDKKYKVFRDDFKKALEEEDHKTLREKYNDDIDRLRNISDEKRKEVLVKFYEKLDELLKKKEEGEDIEEGDIMRDFLSTEEIEKTPEIEISEIEEVSEEVKKEIKEVFKGLENEKRGNFKYNFAGVVEDGYSDSEVLSLWEAGSPIDDFLQENEEIFEGVTVGQIMKIMKEKDEEERNETVSETGEISEEMKEKIKGAINNLSDDKLKEFGKIIKDNRDFVIKSNETIEELLSENVRFDGMFGDWLGIKFDEVKNVKAKDFMEMVEGIYDEVKGEREDPKDDELEIGEIIEKVKIAEFPKSREEFKEFKKNLKKIKDHLSRNRNKKNEHFITDFNQKLDFMLDFLISTDRQFEMYRDRGAEGNKVEAIDEFTEIINSQKKQIEKLEEGDAKKYIKDILNKIEEWGKEKGRIREN